jgi:hypothetical protein
MQLRFLQTLAEVLASPNNNTVIAFPLPLDVRGLVPQGPVLGESAPTLPALSPNGGAQPELSKGETTGA